MPLLKNLAQLLSCLPFLLLAACSKETNTVVQGYIEGQFIYLSSSLSGDLNNLLIHRGEKVKDHQTLFILDPEPQQSELQQAQSKLVETEQNLENLITSQRKTVIEGIIAQRNQSQAQLVYAKQTLVRYQELYRTHAIGKAQLDEATSDYHAKWQQVQQYEANLSEAKLGSRKHLILAQEAAVEAAQANVKELVWELEQKTLVAPSSGKIFDTFFKVGEYVPAGQPVTALLTPSNIKLIFYIPEPLLSHLKVNSIVSFKCDGCKLTKATVNYISPQAEYTPPVIYSHDVRAKLVYRVEASMPAKVAVQFNSGQPVDVYLSNSET